MQNCTIEVVYLEAEEMKDYRAIRVNERKELRGGGLPETLSGDSLRLNQVMLNLIKNAMKFASNAAGLIVIYVAFDKEINLLRVCVSDNGRGVRPEQRASIFEKFGKLKRTAAMNSEGIGLGLFISKRLVEANGGELRCESQGMG